MSANNYPQPTGLDANATVNPLDPLFGVPTGNTDPLSPEEKANNDRSNVFDLQRKVRNLGDLVAPPVLTVVGTPPTITPKQFKDCFVVQYDNMATDYHLWVYAQGMGWKKTLLS